jgi:hypothetical protein
MYEGVGVQLHAFLNLSTVVNGELHVPAFLSMGKETTIPFR